MVITDVQWCMFHYTHYKPLEVQVKASSLDLSRAETIYLDKSVIEKKSSTNLVFSKSINHQLVHTNSIKGHLLKEQQ